MMASMASTKKYQTKTPFRAFRFVGWLPEVKKHVELWQVESHVASGHLVLARPHWIAEKMLYQELAEHELLQIGICSEQSTPHPTATVRVITIKYNGVRHHPLMLDATNKDTALERVALFAYKYTKIKDMKPEEWEGTAIR